MATDWNTPDKDIPSTLMNWTWNINPPGIPPACALRRTGCYPHSPLRTALCSDSVTQPRRASTGLHQRRQLLVSLRFHAVLPWCTADPPHAGSTSPGVESTYELWFKNPNKATISLWIRTLSWDVLRVIRNKRLISSANCNVTNTKGATLRMLSVRIRSWKNPCRISFG